MRTDTVANGRLFEPWWLAALAVAGFVGVLGLPALGYHLPAFGSTQHARWAATCVGVFVLVWGFLYLIARGASFDRRALPWVGGFNAAVIVVKFALSPSAFERRAGSSLSSFVGIGVAVLPLYVAAIYVSYLVASRRPLSGLARTSLGLGIAAVAVLVRFGASVALGTRASYVHDLGTGRALILPALVFVASMAVLESYRRANGRMGSVVALLVVLVVVEHLWWVAYMYGLFS